LRAKIFSPQKAFLNMFLLVFDSEMRDFAQDQGKIRFYTGGIHEVCRGLIRLRRIKI
jgi:hypothetical protein